VRDDVEKDDREDDWGFVKAAGRAAEERRSGALIWFLSVRDAEVQMLRLTEAIMDQSPQRLSDIIDD